MTSADFAKSLRAQRERLKLKQESAARICGVSERTFHHWERGSGNPMAVTMEGVLARMERAKDAGEHTAFRTV